MLIKTRSRERIEAIICDMDGTAVHYSNEPFHSSWDALVSILDDEERVKWFSIRDKYVSRQGVYDEWFKEQVGLLAGKKLEDAERVLFPVPYTKGFYDFFQNKNGFKRMILSSGVGIVAERIKQELNFDDCIAQSLDVQEGVFTGTGSYSFSDDKTEGLLQIAKRFNLNLKKVCYVGDTDWDISCLEIVGYPVVFDPKKALKKLEEYIELKKIRVIHDFKELNKIFEMK